MLDAKGRLYEIVIELHDLARQLEFYDYSIEADRIRHEADKLSSAIQLNEH
jgi:hypothetical protein